MLRGRNIRCIGATGNCSGPRALPKRMVPAILRPRARPANPGSQNYPGAPAGASHPWVLPRDLRYQYGSTPQARAKSPSPDWTGRWWTSDTVSTRESTTNRAGTTG